MRYRTIYLEALLTCRRCAQPVPVNGFVAAASCRGCGELNELDPKTWSNHFLVDRVASAYADESRQRFECAWYPPDIDLACGADEIACPGCRATLEVEAVVETAANGTRCPSCARLIRVRDAEAVGRGLHPAALFIVAETANNDDTRADDHQRRPIVFACMQCGGGLSVDGRSRSVTCSYCAAANYLPDALWREINPVPVPRRFYLVCGVDDSHRDARDELEADPRKRYGLT